MAKTVDLNSLCSDVIDCPHSTPVWQNEGVYVVRNFNIKHGELDFSEASYVDEETYKARTQRAIPEEGDLIISREAPMGDVCIIPHGIKCCLGQRVVLLKVNKGICNPSFLVFAVLSDYVQKQISVINKTGSIVSNLNIPDLKSLNIPSFSKPEQDNIASVLSSITKKIRLNNQIIALLERTAKLLYDYWFVQFEFPNAEGKPYRTSGGEMVYNKQLKRDVPKGWEISSINDMSSSCRGVSYEKSDIISDSEDGVLVLRGNNIQSNHLIYDNNVVYIPRSFVSDEQRIMKYDIIMTMSSGSKMHIGKCTMFQYNSPHTFGAFLSKFTPQNDKRFFVFRSMISDFCSMKIKAICNGTGINNLTNQHFDEILFAVPDSTILKLHEERMNIIYEQIGHKERENYELSAIRDFLLPLLMNGQVRVFG